MGESEPDSKSSGAHNADVEAGTAASGSSGWQSWQKWADEKAKKVAESAAKAVAYEAVPTAESQDAIDGAGSGDVEKGTQAAPSVFGWADKARQQVAEQAKHAQKNLAKAAEN